MPNKKVTLIRHGESEAQTCRQRGLRRTDPSLLDCFLTPHGIHQAIELSNRVDLIEGVDLVCTSPLTRAMATCVLGLGDLSSSPNHNANEGGGAVPVPFIWHADLAERGKIPENTTRPPNTVVRFLKKKLRHFHPAALHALDSIDFSLLDEADDGMPFLPWLARRTESNIVVVCHHNVILQLLKGHYDDRVRNCEPIVCTWKSGRLVSHPIEN
eukprot:scaffold128551_cov45-Attheya_sp.AAC.3